MPTGEWYSKTHTCRALRRANEESLTRAVHIGFREDRWEASDQEQEGQFLSHILFCPFCGDSLEKENAGRGR